MDWPFPVGSIWLIFGGYDLVGWVYTGLVSFFEFLVGSLYAPSPTLY